MSFQLPTGGERIAAVMDKIWFNIGTLHAKIFLDKHGPTPGAFINPGTWPEIIRKLEVLWSQHMPLWRNIPSIEFENELKQWADEAEAVSSTIKFPEHKPV